MKRNTAHGTRALRDWTVRLDCGHPLSLPWGLAPHFVAACIVQHQESCPIEQGEGLELSPGIPWVAGRSVLR